MRHPDLDDRIALERRRYILAEAAHDRLVREALSAHRMAASRQPYRIQRLRDGLLLSFARALSWIGGSMLDWSCRLQYRYSLLAEAAAEKRSSPCA